MIGMLRVLIDKVDNMKEQMGNISREKFQGGDQNKMLEIKKRKNTATEMRYDFGGLVLDTTDERTSENLSILLIYIEIASNIDDILRIKMLKDILN